MQMHMCSAVVLHRKIVGMHMDRNLCNSKLLLTVTELSQLTVNWA